MLDRSSSLRGRSSTAVVLSGAVGALALLLALFFWLRSDARDAAGEVARSAGAAQPGAASDLAALASDAELAGRFDTLGPAVINDGFAVQPGVRLSGPGRLDGRVLERASGAPVAGAQVELLPLPPVGQEFFGRALRLAKTGSSFASRVESIAVAASAADGSFAFEGVHTGTYYIQARGARHVPDSVARVVVAASGAGGPVDVWLRRGGRILGRVLLPDGKPAGGAQLALTLGPGLLIEGLRNGDGCYLEARSDDAGQFVIAGVPAGAGYDLTATGAGFALSHALDVTVKAGEDTLVVVQTRWGGGVEGRVVTRELDAQGAQGVVKPLAGAHVAVVPRGLRDLQFAEELLHQTHTLADASGRFRIEHVPPGEFDLVGVAEGHLPAKGPRVLSADGALATAPDFELPRGPMVSGRVLDRSGAPVAGVFVRWNPVDFRNFQFDFSFAPLLAASVEGFEYPTTDADGRFTAGAFADAPPHRIEFFKSGYENAVHRWDPAQEQDGFEIVLDKGGVIEGIVMDSAQHAPITRFTIETRDRVEVQADAPGNLNPFSGGLLIESPDGRFRIDPVKSGEKIRLTFRAPGHLEKSLDDLEVAEGETLRGVIVELAPGGTVVGSVSDSDGAPVGGAQVFAVPAERSASFERRRGGRGRGPLGGGGPPELEQIPPGFRDFAAQMGLLGDRAVLSKPDGSFELSGLEPGSTVVLASHRDFVIGKSDPVLVAAAAPAEVEIELSKGGGVYGRALDRFGRPVAGAIVIAASPANFAGEGRTNGGGLYQGRTNTSGDYRIERMVGGGYFLVLTRGDEALNPMSFLGTLNFDMLTVPEDESVEYDIVDTSSGATHVSGRVLDGGAPVTSGAVTAISFESESMLGVDVKFAQVRDDGGYEFAGLAPGEYQFNVEAGRRGGRARIVAEIPDVPEFRLDLTFPEGAVEGRVVDARDGASVVGASVTLRLEDPFESSGWLGGLIAQEAGVERANTDDEGGFRFQRLNAGRYQLAVRPRRDAGAGALAPSDPLLVEVRENAVTRGVEVRLVASVELAGKVRDAAGAPVADALLIATRADRPGALPERVTSDDEGGFRFAALAAGAYEVSANADGFADTLVKGVVVGDAKREPLEIVLDRGIDVRVRIVGATGQPVSGATGRLVRKGGAAAVGSNDVGRAVTNLFSGKGVSDSKGLLALGTFGAGEYRLEVQRGLERAEEDVVLSGHGEQELRVRLR